MRISDADVEAERPIILEEWRRGKTSSGRSSEAYFRCVHASQRTHLHRGPAERIPHTSSVCGTRRARPRRWQRAVRRHALRGPNAHRPTGCHPASAARAGRCVRPTRAAGPPGHEADGASARGPARGRLDQFRDFYKRWYRPEHMTVIAVGDFDDLDLVGQWITVRRRMRDFRRRWSCRPWPRRGEATQSIAADIYAAGGRGVRGAGPMTLLPSTGNVCGRAAVAGRARTTTPIDRMPAPAHDRARPRPRPRARSHPQTWCAGALCGGLGAARRFQRARRRGCLCLKTPKRPGADATHAYACGPQSWALNRGRPSCARTEPSVLV